MDFRGSTYSKKEFQDPLISGNHAREHFSFQLLGRKKIEKIQKWILKLHLVCVCVEIQYFVFELHHWSRLSG